MWYIWERSLSCISSRDQNSGWIIENDCEWPADERWRKCMRKGDNLEDEILIGFMQSLFFCRSFWKTRLLNSCARDPSLKNLIEEKRKERRKEICWQFMRYLSWKEVWSTFTSIKKCTAGASNSAGKCASVILMLQDTRVECVYGVYLSFRRNLLTRAASKQLKKSICCWEHYFHRMETSLMKNQQVYKH